MLLLSVFIFKPKKETWCRSNFPTFPNTPFHFPKSATFLTFPNRWESEVIPLEALYHKGLHLNFPLSHFYTFPFSWESVSPCSIRVFPTFPLSHIYIPILVWKVGKRISYICIHICYLLVYRCVPHLCGLLLLNPSAMLNPLYWVGILFFISYSISKISSKIYSSLYQNK